MGLVYETIGAINGLGELFSTMSVSLLLLAERAFSPLAVRTAI